MKTLKRLAAAGGARRRRPKRASAQADARRRAARAGGAGAPAALARLLALLLPAGAARRGAAARNMSAGSTRARCASGSAGRTSPRSSLALLAFTVAAARPRSRTLTLLAALAIAVSGAIGVFHAGVEAWHVGRASRPAPPTRRDRRPADEIMNAPLVRCDQVQWSLPRHFAGRVERDPVARRRGDHRLARARRSARHERWRPGDRAPTAHRCCASTRPANMARPGSMPASSRCCAAIRPPRTLIAAHGARRRSATSSASTR